MRKSEILNLKWVDVDLHNGIIHIPDSKSGERRDVPMSDILLGTLIELKKKAKLDCVFTTSKGKVRPIKDIRTIFSNALKKSGITNFRFHDLRHTFASYLVMNGVDLRTVQELLGHKDFSMTLRYSHLSPAHKKDAVKVMDRITEKCIWHTFGTLSNSVKIVK
jgi:integrase